jgi:hypothetical protein
MRKLLSTIAAAGALAVAAAAATPAAAIDFVGNWDVDYYDGLFNGLNINVSDEDGGLGFSLDGVGSSVSNNYDVHLFNLWAGELTTFPNDYLNKPITVNFDFSQPATGGAVNGTTSGEIDWHKVWIFDVPHTYGENNWSGVQSFDFGNAGKLNVLVYNVGGLSGHNTGTFDIANSTEVRAKFWIDPMPSAVPEPGTWALMITGFGLAGAALRRQRKLAMTAA